MNWATKLPKKNQISKNSILEYSVLECNFAKNNIIWIKAFTTRDIEE